jgi:hypothetical protein
MTNTFREDFKMAAAEIFLKTKTRFSFVAHLRRWMGTKEALPVRETEETRARLDFVLELMDAHPEAFASEEAVRCSALYFSGRF